MNVYHMPGHLIRRLNQMSTQMFSHHVQVAGYDLTPVQFAAMDAVRANPGLDQASIAALIAYDRATIGGVIDRLEQKGLVTRSISKRDRRAREVALSDKGHQVYDDVLPTIVRVQGEILESLTDDEKKQFLRLAEKALRSAPNSFCLT